MFAAPSHSPRFTNVGLLLSAVLFAVLVCCGAFGVYLGVDVLVDAWTGREPLGLGFVFGPVIAAFAVVGAWLSALGLRLALRQWRGVRDPAAVWWLIRVDATCAIAAACLFAFTVKDAVGDHRPPTASFVALWLCSTTAFAVAGMALQLGGSADDPSDSA